MYAALWRVLPGPVWAKVLWSVGIVVAIGTLLMAFVFPFLADTFLVEGSTVGTP